MIKKLGQQTVSIISDINTSLKISYLQENTIWIVRMLWVYQILISQRVYLFRNCLRWVYPKFVLTAYVWIKDFISFTETPNVPFIQEVRRLICSLWFHRYKNVAMVRSGHVSIYIFNDMPFRSHLLIDFHYEINTYKTRILLIGWMGCNKTYF